MEFSSLHLRLIQPFCFDTDGGKSSRAARIEQFVRVVNEAEPSWTLPQLDACSEQDANPMKVDGHYRKEFLEAVQGFLFDHHDHDCRYAALSVTNQSIGDRQLEIWQKEKQPADGLSHSTSPGSGQPKERAFAQVDCLNISTRGCQPVEIWAAGSGVGILSVSFRLELPQPNENRPGSAPKDMELDRVLSLLHGMVYPDRNDSLRILFSERPQSEAANDGAWRGMQEQEDIAATESRCSPIGRLAQRQARFEWCDFLAACRASLSGKGLTFHFPETRLSACLVLEAADPVDFENEADRQAAIGCLERIVAVTAPTHPGFVPSQSPLSTVCLTRKHLACVGHFDAGHIVAGQGGGYDPQRVLRAERTYFIPYLLATLNQLTYERSLTDLRLCSSTAQNASQIAQLRDDLLAHRLASSFHRISKRESIDRFAECVNRAQGVEPSLAKLKDVINERDDVDRSRHDTETLDATHKVEGQLLELDRRVEWIEVLLLSFYGIELVNTLREALEWNQHLFLASSYVVLAIAFLIISYLTIAPYNHNIKVDTRRCIKGLLAAILVIAVWLAAGFTVHATSSQASGSATSETLKSPQSPQPAAAPAKEMEEAAAPPSRLSEPATPERRAAAAKAP